MVKRFTLKFPVFLLSLLLTFPCIISYAQQTGNKVQLTAVDGKVYTGTITDVSNGKYKVHYDNFNFDAWLTKDQFQVISNNAPAPGNTNVVNNQNNEQQNNQAEDKKIKMSTGSKPTKDDVIAVMKSAWEKAGNSMNPKVTITINSIVFGSSSKANYADELEGIPKNALITVAKIDFTANTFYTDGVQKTRRIMTAAVYRNKFNEWDVMNTATVYPDK